MEKRADNLSVQMAVNWAKERILGGEVTGGRFLDKLTAVSLSIDRWMQAKARLDISMRAVLIDRKLPNNPDKNFSYKVCGDIFGALDEVAEKQGGFPLKVLKTDSVTREEYWVEVNRDGTTWSAREVRTDGSLISEAKIGKDSTSLSLDFKEERYQKMNADMKVTEARDLPLATRVVFKFLTNEIIRTKANPRLR